MMEFETGTTGAGDVCSPLLDRPECLRRWRPHGTLSVFFVQSKLDWYTQHAAAMDIDLDEELVKDCRVDPYDRKQEDRRLKQMHRALKEALVTPQTIFRGAYLASGSNVKRKEMHMKALSHTISLDEPAEDEAESEESVE